MTDYRSQVLKYMLCSVVASGYKRTQSQPPRLYDCGELLNSSEIQRAVVRALLDGYR